MNLTAVTAASNVLSNLPLLLSRTPVWVWGLLLGLIALGFMQARTRELTYKRVLIIPIVMLVLSLLGAVSTAGGSFAAVGLWALGYVAVAYALSRRALPASVYAPDAGRFTVTGSYAPLGVMVAIFVIKFAVGVATAMGAAWVRSDAFSVVIAAFYGGFSGFFAGRALRLLRLAPFEPKAIVKPLLKTIAVLLFIVGLVLASLLMLGGPKPIAALPSINKPFASVDYSALPPTSTFKARDGAILAYLHYPAAQNTSIIGAKRVVLVHGSSANARSMHPLALGLSAAGFTVDALDMRGHGASGNRGHIGYIGQLEDDVADFMRAVPQAGRNTLMGFSSGGGFALRFAGGAQQGVFSDYLLLSPYLKHDAPTAKSNNGGWVSVGIARIVALQVLNGLGITAFNGLTVLQFALNDGAKTMLTPTYDYALMTNFAPHSDYAKDIAQAKGALRIVAGADDELFDTSKFASVFAHAGKPVTVTLVPRTKHIGLTLTPEAIQAIVNACKIAP
jgi:alpha-beta hydrolase superfamily lysophospholipase